MIQSTAITKCNDVAVFLRKNTNQLIFHGNLKSVDDSISTADNGCGNNNRFILFDEIECRSQSFTIMTKILELNVCCGFQFQFVVHAESTVNGVFNCVNNKNANAASISTSGILNLILFHN